MKKNIFMLLMLALPFVGFCQVKISSLPAVPDSARGTDVIPIVRDGATKKITVNQLLAAKAYTGFAGNGVSLSGDTLKLGGIITTIPTAVFNTQDSFGLAWHNDFIGALAGVGLESRRGDDNVFNGVVDFTPYGGKEQTVWNGYYNLTTGNLNDFSADSTKVQMEAYNGLFKIDNSGISTNYNNVVHQTANSNGWIAYTDNLGTQLYSNVDSLTFGLSNNIGSDIYSNIYVAKTNDAFRDIQRIETRYYKNHPDSSYNASVFYINNLSPDLWNGHFTNRLTSQLVYASNYEYSSDTGTGTFARLDSSGFRIIKDASTLFKIANTGTLTVNDGTQGDGKVLTSDASGNASWQVPSGGGGSPEGSNTWVQYNNSGSFGADSAFVFYRTGPENIIPVLSVIAPEHANWTGEIHTNNFVVQAGDGYNTTINMSDSATDNLTFSLPITAGNGGDMLTTDGEGNLSWQAPHLISSDSAAIYALTPNAGTQYYCNNCTGNATTGYVVVYTGSGWRKLQWFE